MAVDLERARRRIEELPSDSRLVDVLAGGMLRLFTRNSELEELIARQANHIAALERKVEALDRRISAIPDPPTIEIAAAVRVGRHGARHDGPKPNGRASCRHGRKPRLKSPARRHRSAYRRRKRGGRYQRRRRRKARLGARHAMPGYASQVTSRRA